MKTFKVMDYSGHTTLEFKESEVAEAMEKFRALVEDEKKTAGTRKAGETDYTVVRDYKATQDETIFAPAMAGG